MNCPNCGAAIKEGKFCNYCGAKLPDNTQHIEVDGKVDHNVNINWLNQTRIKRMEKKAEIEKARLELEAKAAEERRKKAESDNKSFHKMLLVMLACAALLFIMALLAKK